MDSIEHKRLSQLLSVVLPLLPIGLAFGWLAAGQGLTTIEVLLMSTLGFTGSGQFVWLQLSAQQAPAFVVFALLLATNLRYIPMTLTAQLSAGSSPVLRAIGAHFLSDESYALEQGQPDDRTRLWLRAAVAATWILATSAGTLLLSNDSIRDPAVQRLASFAGSSVLIALASGRLRSSLVATTTDAALLVGGGLVAVTAIGVCGGRWFWIPSLILGFAWIRLAQARRQA